MPWPKGMPQPAEMKSKRLATLAARKTRHKAPNADGTWRCSTCQEDKPANEFYASKRTPSGLGSQCRACHTKGCIRTRDAESTRDARRASEANRRARMAGATGRVTRASYEKLAELLGAACLCCGSTDQPTWDHVVPLARGGAHHERNLQPLCRPCNERKQARTADHRTDAQRAAVDGVWVVEFRRAEAK